MKRYKDYMDGIEASDTLHEKLKNLEPPQKRPAAWKKYGAVAAVLMLVAGIGAYSLSQGGWNAIMENFRPAAEVTPEKADIPAPFPNPDIAFADPNDPNAITDRTGGGYELIDGEFASYYVLPRLDWTDASALPQASMDYSLAPLDAIRRDAAWDDILLFMGGEKAMADHLLWDGFTWDGTLWFLKDGTPCGASFSSDWVDGTHLYLEVMRGGEVPSCVVLPDKYYETSQWQGVKITALKNTGYAVEGGVKLFQWVVSLYSNGVGYKLTLWTDDDQWANELCARFVRYAVDGGFHLYALSYEPAYDEDLPDKGFPPETVPTANILHPGDPGYIEPFPTPDGGAMTTPYNPSAPT